MTDKLFNASEKTKELMSGKFQNEKPETFLITVVNVYEVTERRANYTDEDLAYFAQTYGKKISKTITVQNKKK